jgi:hypothetical protein
MLTDILRPKLAMILGVLCMLAGLIVYALWNVRGLGDWDIAGTGIVEWCREKLGRYGITAFYFFGGLIIFLRGYVGLRMEEKQRRN